MNPPPHNRGRNNTLVALLDYLAKVIERQIPSQSPAIYHKTLEQIFDGCVKYAIAHPRVEWDLLDMPARSRLALAGALAPLATDPRLAPAAWRALMDACGTPHKPHSSIPSDGWYDRDHVLRAIEATRTALVLQADEAGTSPEAGTDGKG